MMDILEMANLIDELQEQDKMFNILLQRRKEIAKLAKENNRYRDMYEILFSDKQPHWGF